MMDKDYVEEILEGLGHVERVSVAAFRRATQVDVNAGYRAEVEHVEKLLFGEPDKVPGYDFPCKLRSGPAGDCGAHNCRCMR